MLTTRNMPTLALTDLPPLSRAALRLAETVVAWEMRQRSRKHLGRLDPHLLRDIGLHDDTATAEIRKPFWRA